MTNIIDNQKEIERKAKLWALKNYKLSDNFKALEWEIKERKEKAKATLITAYCEKQIIQDENWTSFSDYYTEEKKYNHKVKFAVWIEIMSEIIELIDDSEGWKIIKEKIQEWINNSEDHIWYWIVKFFPNSWNVVEYRYSDIEFTYSDLLLYKAQVAEDTIRVIDWLIEEFTKSVADEIDEEILSESVEE